MSQQRVFLSHSSKDADAAEGICAALEQAGVLCWMAPRNIPPSSDYASAIVDAIRDSRALVVLLSRHANDSPHIVREVERAASHKLRLFPLRLEDVKPAGSLEYFLSNAQWIDAFSWRTKGERERIADQIKRALPDAVAGSMQPPNAPKTRFELRRAHVLLGLLALVVIVGGVIGARYVSQRDRQPGSEIAAIALDSMGVGVSRFEDLSADKAGAYIGAGLTDHLTSVLTATGLSVKVSGSSESADIRQLGAQLGVAHLVRGSVQQDGKRVRVSAQLLRSNSGAVSWAQTYDRSSDDIFALEDSVSLAIATAIKGRLLPSDSVKLQSHPTAVVAAYDAYLRGKFAAQDSTLNGLRDATTHLEQAVRLDPRFASAYRDLSSTYAARARTDTAAREELLRRAASASQRAAVIKANLSQAGATLTPNVGPGDRKTAADTGALRVLPFARRDMSGIAFVNSASASKQTRTAFDDYYAGDFAAAEAAFRERLQANARDVLAHSGLAYTLLATRRAREALTTFERAAGIDPSDVLAVAGYGAAAAALRDSALARATVGHIDRVISDPGERALGRAIVMNAMGQRSVATALVRSAKLSSAFLSSFAQQAPVLRR